MGLRFNNQDCQVANLKRNGFFREYFETVDLGILPFYIIRIYFKRIVKVVTGKKLPRLLVEEGEKFARSSKAINID